MAPLQSTDCLCTCTGGCSGCSSVRAEAEAGQKRKVTLIVFIYLTNATILTVKYSSLFLKSPLPSCWSRDSVQAYSFQPPALWWSSTSSLCRLKHSGSGELWMSLCGHRAKVRNPWDIVSGRYRFIHVCNTPHHIHTVLQNTERHLNSLTHFVASREGSRREPRFFGKS